MTFVLILIGLVVVAIMLSACRAASIADQQMEYAFAEWLKTHPEKELSE